MSFNATVRQVTECLRDQNVTAKKDVNVSAKKKTVGACEQSRVVGSPA